jgi:hypothetical protein
VIRQTARTTSPVNRIPPRHVRLGRLTGFSLARALCIRSSCGGCRILNFRVDLATDEKCGAPKIDPEEQYQNRAERSINGAVRVEIAEIQAQSCACRGPEDDRRKRSGKEPEQLLAFQVRSESVYNQNGRKNKREDNRPFENVPEGGPGRVSEVTCQGGADPRARQKNAQRDYGQKA